MRVLVTFGSKRGGTRGIAEMLAGELGTRGVDVDLLPAKEALRRKLDYDGAIIGGAVYANRWHRDARRFVARREKDLGKIPVWMFSSGPLDDSAEERPIPAPPQVSVLMERIGAVDHITFGGRLLPNATGFPASAMAKKSSGDWRHPEHVRSWAAEIASELPLARPRPPIDQPGHAISRLLYHGVAGWALCAAVMLPLLFTTGPHVALLVNALLLPLVFGVVARFYFHGRGARSPLTAALVFIVMVAAFDLIAGWPLHRFASLAGFWVPVASIFLVTWAVGGVMSMMPFPKHSPAA